MLELKLEKPVKMKAAHIEEVTMEGEFPDSHFLKPHSASTTTETPVRIGDVKEPVVTLIDHGSKIKLMLMDFYKQGKWPINTKHG